MVDVDAGDAASWLTAVRVAIRTSGPMDVPCGDCVACCTSGQFVHVEPGEPALRVIPPALRFPAPGLPEGHVLLPYDAAGRCPMYVEGRGCSIYDDRPRACRTYDCRVFAAAGVVPASKPAIARRVAAWRFGGDPDAVFAPVRAAADPAVANETERALKAVMAT